MAADDTSYSPGEMDHGGLFKSRHFRMHRFAGRPRSEHDGMELFFTGTDAQTIRVGRDRVALTRGTLVVFNAHETHGVEHGHGSFSGLVIPSRVVEEVADELPVRAGELVFERSAQSIPPQVQSHLDDLMATRDVPRIDQLVVDLALTSLVIHLLSSQRHSQSHAMRSLSRSGRFPSLTARAKAAIFDLALEPDVGLSDLARHAGYSKSHFIRVVKAASGVTPVEIRNRIRVDAAMHKLRRTRQRVSDIAQDVGFRDLSTFNRAFLRFAGISPTAYRMAINA